jgi:hypothetical protein
MLERCWLQLRAVCIKSQAWSFLSVRLVVGRIPSFEAVLFLDRGRSSAWQFDFLPVVVSRCVCQSRLELFLIGNLTGLT